MTKTGQTTKITTYEVIKNIYTNTTKKEIHEVMTTFKVQHMGVIGCTYRIT